MNQLHLFLPCAAGVEDYLAQEVLHTTGLPPAQLAKHRAGVQLQASWRDVLLLNLHSRLAQRVLVQLSHTAYRSEQDLYRAASEVAWETWFTPKQSIKVEVTAQHSPLTSLNFAALKIKDAVCDRFRAKAHGVRPDVDTQWPDVRLYAHLTTEHCTLYIDTSGEPLFKRGWRQDKGDAPLKETLAAAMLAASGWADGVNGALQPLYDPCCGSGTIAIEAAQIACHIAPGSRRRFAFEKMLPFQPHVWAAIQQDAAEAECLPPPGMPPLIHASDVSHRMVDFAQRNAERAGVASVIAFRGGDALQRLPPLPLEDGVGGVMLLNPPYGERIEVGGVARNAARPMPRHMAGQRGAQAGARAQGERAERNAQPAPGQPVPDTLRAGREAAQVQDGGEFFTQLASHWKRHYSGWTAWLLTPDLKLPSTMRLKESRRVPLWNGPLECRLFRFDMVAGRMPDKGAP